MPKLFFSLILSMFLFNTVHACETSKKAITSYLKYDFEGERLGSKAADHIDELTANPYEPAWDVLTLNTGYEIHSIKQNKKNAVVTVVFKKSWEIARKFQPELVRDEVIEVHLEKINGCWKVGPPFYTPHVSSQIALRHFEQLIEDGEKEKMDKEYMDYTRSVLDSIRQYMDAIKPKDEGK